MIQIQRDEIFNFLDKTSEKYQDYCVAINSLPQNTIFDIIVDDSVTAEYFDSENQKLYQFDLIFDYDIIYKGSTQQDFKEIEEFDTDSFNRQKSNIVMDNQRIHLISKSIMFITLIAIILYVILR